MRGEAPNYCLQPTRPPGLTAGWDMSSGLAAEAMALDNTNQAILVWSASRGCVGLSRRGYLGGQEIAAYAGTALR